MKEAVSLKLTASFLNMAPPAGLEPATYGLTTDTGIFNPLLYRLSYRGATLIASTGRIKPFFRRQVNTYFKKIGVYYLFACLVGKTHI